MRGVKRGLLLYVIIFTIMNTIACTKIEEKEKRELRIGITVYNRDDTFIMSILKIIKEQAIEIEKKENIKIVIDILDAKGNMIEQDKHIEKFIKQKYDVICVNIVDRTVASTIIDKSKKENIPIVFFNREIVEDDMKRWSRVYYVGADAKESGELQGEIVATKYKENPKRIDKNGDGKIQYVILEGEQGHQDTTLRTEYCVKPILRSGIGLEKLGSDTANWRKSQAMVKMKEWIKAYGNKIEVVFCNNDEMALGAIEVLEEFLYKAIVVGVDGTNEALESVKEGKLSGTIISDAKEQGSKILEIAYYLGNNMDDQIEKNIFKAPHKMVTKKNLLEYIAN